MSQAAELSDEADVEEVLEQPRLADVARSRAAARRVVEQMLLPTKSDIVLSEPQRLFARSKFRFPAFVGGFGSGKTTAGVLRAIALKTQCVGCDVAYYLPTYSLIADIAIPRFTQMLSDLGIRYRVVRSPPPYIELPDHQGQIKFRTMDSPEKIVGYEVAHSILDEFDTLPVAKAEDVWIKVLARNRQKSPTGNTVGVVTTPEGFRYVYQRWVKKSHPDYRLYRARTLDNAANLPAGYIDSLRNTYPEHLLAAYLDGEFVNLTSGSVYPQFDRVRNFTNDTVKDKDALHIGMDFNVTKMAAIVHVLRDGKPRAVAELVNVFDTPAMIALIKSRYAGHPVFVYPDASGGGRRTVMASESDLSLLRQAQFRVCVNTTNPAVKDRVLSMNKVFETGAYLVNPDTCPTYVEGLEQQAYTANGEPDKSAGLDHPLDAGGYFITYKFPVVKRSGVLSELRI